ncbi:MAG: hypothetical protein HC911_05985, partial [Chloroflexaceae bacterium]|nr:hypothetical protein [Chloroflexaceae bacterium]
APPPPSYAPPAPAASPDGLLSQLLAQREELQPAPQPASPAPPIVGEHDPRAYIYTEKSEPNHESAYQHPPAEPTPESDPATIHRHDA